MYKCCRESSVRNLLLFLYCCCKFTLSMLCVTYVRDFIYTNIQPYYRQFDCIWVCIVRRRHVLWKANWMCWCVCKLCNFPLTIFFSSLHTNSGEIFWNIKGAREGSWTEKSFFCRSDKRTLFGGVGFLGKMLCVWHEKWKMRSILCGNKFLKQPRTLVWFLYATCLSFSPWDVIIVIANGGKSASYIYTRIIETIVIWKSFSSTYVARR